MISMKNINKVYDNGKVSVHALKEVSIEIGRGEYMAITGPSGSGKSTMMHILGCLDTPNSGEYKLDQKLVSHLSIDALTKIRNQKIGFVFQNFFLMPYLTAKSNVELPMIFAGMKKKERTERTMMLLEKVGMADRASHRPNELSGGQQQRIAIARALANNPEILLADEPTGNLDSKSGKEVIQLFEELWQQGKTVVMITHDPNVAKQCKRKIKLIDAKIVEDILQ